jgi:hypothetical protein
MTITVTLAANTTSKIEEGRRGEGNRIKGERERNIKEDKSRGVPLTQSHYMLQCKSNIPLSYSSQQNHSNVFNLWKV